MKNYNDRYSKFTDDELINVILTFQVIKNLCHEKKFNYENGEQLPDFFFTIWEIQDDIRGCLFERKEMSQKEMA